MTAFTKRKVEKYTDARVVCGDVDAVMIKFGHGDMVMEATQLGQDAAVYVMSVISKPI